MCLLGWLGQAVRGDVGLATETPPGSQQRHPAGDPKGKGKGKAWFSLSILPSAFETLQLGLCYYGEWRDRACVHHSCILSHSLVLLGIHVFCVAKVLTMACQPLQDLAPPTTLSSFATTFPLIDFMLAALLFLKQANSMTAPGSLH